MELRRFRLDPAGISQLDGRGEAEDPFFFRTRLIVSTGRQCVRHCFEVDPQVDRHMPKLQNECDRVRFQGLVASAWLQVLGLREPLPPKKAYPLKAMASRTFATFTVTG